MGKRMLLHLSLILLVALSIGCNKRPSDEQIQHDIQTKAAVDPETKDSAVNVAAKDGKVTLTGTVRNEAAAKEMKKIAKEEPGVSDIDDQTSIDPMAAAPSEPEPRASGHRADSSAEPGVELKVQPDWSDIHGHACAADQREWKVSAACWIECQRYRGGRQGQGEDQRGSQA
jgi:hypothetical protein